MAVGPGGNLYKPRGENKPNGLFIAPPNLSNQIQSIHIVDSSGNVLDEGQYRHPYSNGGGIWDFKGSGGSYGTDTQIRINLENGEQVFYGGGGAGRNDAGPIGGGEVSGGSDVPLPPGTTGGGSSGVAALPYYQGGNYPTFQTVGFPSIKPADFQFTDPIEFAKKIGDVNRSEVGKNFEQAKGLSLQALDTELQGLQGFAPAAAAVKRGQIALDNPFNQGQRTSQVDAVLPNARGDLAAQRRRALSYSSGQAPDAVIDNAIELNSRSRAADTATYAGFGARSGASSKLSDLMTADERLKLAQFGEGLETSNRSESASLLLAPTEYSQAGAEIRSTPEVGAGRLTYQGAGMLNEATLTPPTAALNAEIGQQQFDTQVRQRTSEFNATGQFDASKFNSVGTFEAQLGKFQYDTAYLNSLQGANQANLNMATGLGLQGLETGGYNSGLAEGQSQGALSSAIEGIGGVSGAISTISDALTSSGITSGGDTSVGGTTPQQPSQTPAADAVLGDNNNIDVPFSFDPGQSVDSSSPSSLKLAPGVPTPSGYTPVAQNNDGSTSVANNQGYAAELDRFAKSNNIPPGDISVQTAALADRTLASAARLSYVPVSGFRPIGLASSGETIYSNPQAAASGDFTAGGASLSNIGPTLAALGAADAPILDAIREYSGVASDPDYLSSLDQVASERGSDAVAKNIVNKFFGDGLDLKSKNGQKAAMMADKIGKLWPNLSPYQKSMALSAMGTPAIQSKTGKILSEQKIPGTDKSVAGELKVGDVMSLTSAGVNGFSLARNWSQLSALGSIAGTGKDKSKIARVSDFAGLLGFGPQGAAVKVDPNYLNKIGARAAPELGVGAAIFDKPGHVPKNYKIVSTTPEGKPIAMPGNLVHTSTLGAGGPSQLAFKKSVLVAAGKHPSQKLWGKSPSPVSRGSAGGSAIVAGLNTMQTANPAVAGAMTAYSLFSSTMGV